MSSNSPAWKGRRTCAAARPCSAFLLLLKTSNAVRISVVAVLSSLRVKSAPGLPSFQSWTKWREEDEPVHGEPDVLVEDDEAIETVNERPEVFG